MLKHTDPGRTAGTGDLQSSLDAPGGVPGKATLTSALQRKAESSAPALSKSGELPAGSGVSSADASPQGHDVLSLFGRQGELGGEARPLDPAARAAGEKSLGTDLGGVQVHQGKGSAAAASAVGATAFAHGQNIVLGDGVANSLNPVMAHEMAHTAQQKGGAPGIAQKSERVASGSAFELDADRAGAAIMQGRPAQLEQRGAEQIACFEGGEHMQLGTEGFAKAGTTGPLTVGKVKAEAGLFTALQGDFYGGSWPDLEADCNEKPAGVYKLLDVVKREQQLRAAHYADPAHNEEPDSDGAIIIASMGLRAKYLTYASDNATHFGEKSADADKKYAALQADNPAYAGEIGFAQSNFGANVAEYMRLHIDAIKRAFTDAVGGKPADVALAMDAGANHFLTDAFASGHMRTPRDAMMKEYHAVFQAKGRDKVNQFVDQHIPASVDVPAVLGLGGAEAWLPDSTRPPPLNLSGVRAEVKTSLYPTMDSIMSTVADQAANFGAKQLHDADNKGGLKVHNNANMAWTATGDHAMSKEEKNVQIAEMAVAASASHTKSIYELSLAHKGKTGAPPQMPYVSMKPILNLLPVIDPDNAPQQDWHWDSASPAYKQGIVTNLKASISGTVDSAADAIKHNIHEAIMRAVQRATSVLGMVGQWINKHLDALVQWLVEQIPPIPPELLVNSLVV